MRILLLGNTGQLGWELERSLATLGEVHAMDYPIINLAALDSYLPLVESIQPQVIINATAYTAVDRAESETELAYAINTTAPGLLAQEARRLGAAFIHYSTDYVFDGTKGSPYTESDRTNPLGVYGLSKLEGEQAVQQAGGAFLILRTAWVYSLRRDSFVMKVLAWARQQKKLRLVNDQISGPTWARMLAEVTAQVVAKAGNDPYTWLTERSGLYHLAGSGYCSRFEWGQAILQLDPQPQEQIVEEVLPASTTDFPTPARRPLFSALDCVRFREVFGLQLPDWKEALGLAMSDPQVAGEAR
jgi:dTDP-4-dehydrorhamnose reductase